MAESKSESRPEVDIRIYINKEEDIHSIKISGQVDNILSTLLGLVMESASRAELTKEQLLEVTTKVINDLYW